MTRLPISGPLFILGSACSFSLMALNVRVLKDSIPVFEIVFFRALFSFIGAYLLLKKNNLPMKGKSPWPLIGRGLFGFFGMTAYYLAIHELPLSASVTIQQTNPLFAAFAAIFILGEVMTGRLFLSLLGAFAGVLLIADPMSLSHEVWNPFGVAMAVASAVIGGVAYSYVRWLSRREHVLRIVAWFPLVSGAITAFCLFVPLDWIGHVPFVRPDGHEWLCLLLVAGGTLAGQIFLTEGLKVMEAGKATTLGMIQVPMALGLDILVMQEKMPAASQLAGIGLIVISMIWMLKRR